MIIETTQVANPGFFRPRNILIATGVGAVIVGGVWYYRKRKANQSKTKTPVVTTSSERSTKVEVIEHNSGDIKKYIEMTMDIYAGFSDDAITTMAKMLKDPDKYDYVSSVTAISKLVDEEKKLNLRYKEGKKSVVVEEPKEVANEDALAIRIYIDCIRDTYEDLPSDIVKKINEMYDNAESNSMDDVEAAIESMIDAWEASLV